jgi:hypothetical protein
MRGQQWREFLPFSTLRQRPVVNSPAKAEPNPNRPIMTIRNALRQIAKIC